MPEKNCYRELMEKHGIKNTKQREMIFDILERATNPVTAEDIFLKLKETDAGINLSTVYRNLEMLYSLGIVLKTTFMNDDKAKFELKNPDHKHRLICIKCNSMVAIDGCPMEKLEKALELETSYDITGHRLEIYGYCPKCKGEK